MTAAAQTIPAPPPSSPGASSAASPAPGDAAWQRLRASDDLQFAPVEIPEVPPPEPTWFELVLARVFGFLGDLLAPLGQALGASWGWLQWVLLAGAVLFAGVLLLRAFGPDSRRRRRSEADTAPAWQPDRAASLALLEDADRLAAEGRFDAAARLLLQRSVGQIAAARPGLVEPSSTARELAALAALPEAARTAFAAIAERVERSLFALTALERTDWEAARAAYADFALAPLGAEGRGA